MTVESILPARWFLAVPIIGNEQLNIEVGASLLTEGEGAASSSLHADTWIVKQGVAKDFLENKQSNSNLFSHATQQALFPPRRARVQ